MLVGVSVWCIYASSGLGLEFFDDFLIFARGLFVSSPPPFLYVVVCELKKKKKEEKKQGWPWRVEWRPVLVCCGRSGLCGSLNEQSKQLPDVNERI